MSDIEEFKVDSRDFFPKTMFQAKESLRAHKKLKIVGTTLNANQATRLAETLKRLGYIDWCNTSSMFNFGYIEFDDVQTQTTIVNDSRQVKLVITVHITSDFERLYQENLEERKKKEEERKKREEEKKKGEK